MKKSVIGGLFLLVTCLAVTNCSSPSPRTENGASQAGVQVPNGGFETGALAPWSQWQAIEAKIAGDKAHDGKFSVVETGYGAGSVYEDITGLVPGTQYTVSAWTSAEPGSKAAAQIAIYDPQANTATFSQAVVPTSDWQQLKQTVKAGSNGTIRVHLFHNQGTGAIYWDDLQVLPSA